MPVLKPKIERPKHNFQVDVQKLAETCLFVSLLSQCCPKKKNDIDSNWKCVWYLNQQVEKQFDQAVNNKSSDLLSTIMYLFSHYCFKTC